MSVVLHSFTVLKIWFPCLSVLSVIQNWEFREKKHPHKWGCLACTRASLKNSVHSLLIGVLTLKSAIFITKPQSLFHVWAWPVSDVLWVAFQLCVPAGASIWGSPNTILYQTVGKPSQSSPWHFYSARSWKCTWICGSLESAHYSEVSIMDERV